MKKNYTYLYSLIIFFFFYSYQTQAQSNKLTVETIYGSRTFTAQQLRGVQWFDSGNKYSFLKFDPATKSMAIWRHDVKTGDESVMLTGDKLKVKDADEAFTIMNYAWSPDYKYILFTGVLPARKLKTGGAIYIYDIEAKKFSVLAESDKEQSNVRFSPDGSRIAFVRANNLYTVDIKTDKETQLTFDGNDNIINGKFDWVYEEEFQIIDGYDWAPDGKSIAFWRLDQTKVPEFDIARFDSLYMDNLKYKYPKPGAHNSEVRIGVVNVETKKTTWMDLGNEKDIYIPRIKFTNDPTLLSIQRLNRLQNHLELLFADVNTGKTRTVVDEKANEWIDIYDDLAFLKNSKQFIWGSERDGFHHIYLYDYNGKQISQITKGPWVVKSVASFDEQNKTVYYMSNERGRRFTDLYSVRFDGTDKKRITGSAGSHTVNMSPSNQYFIDKYSNINSLPETNLYKADGSKAAVLLAADTKAVKEYGLSQVEFFTIKTSDNVDLDAYIVKPADFDENKKYPVIIMQYNGPGSQQVTDGWGSADMWEHMLTQKGYIILSVDCRITGGRGSKSKEWAYKDLGHWEINDLIETAKYLRSLKYVDGERLGIWGWSYGGYTSSLTILKASDYFKAAIAVAPVTSWLFYDSIYTERYMSLPALNPQGYKESSPLNYADKLKGKFLLIHGMADDNVHFQNSVQLVNKLIDANKQFRVMYYPGRDHSIYGGNTRVQLYNMMTDFFLNNL